MTDRMLFDPDAVVLPSGALINGTLVAGDGTAFDVLRPSDGKVARAERGASKALVDQAVRAAHAAHKSGSWSNASPQEKAAVFRRWASLAEARIDELVSLEAVVSTRLASEARTRDIPLTIAIISYYGGLIDKIEGQVLASPAGTLSLTLREPHGVVAAITPWNVPLVLAAIKLVPALAAGNAVVLKPSEFTPYSIVRLAQLAIEAGVPAGQIAIVPGNGTETGNALVTHPLVDYVTFTGSTATGARVMADAALSGPKPVSLELGGKSPQLVFADADLDATARIVAGSVTRNAGQICYAGTRLVVERSVADPLLDRIMAHMAELAPGPTWGAATNLSPIISQPQSDRIGDIVRQGVAAGAEILIGGSAFDDEAGYFFRPTIIETPTDNPVIRDELFGPVLAVQRFDGTEEALALADHAEYGLAGAVHTRDLNKVLRCCQELQVGTVWVNHFGPADISSPVGGYKRSGFGKDFGVEGLQKYLKTKHVWLAAG